MVQLGDNILSLLTELCRKNTTNWTEKWNWAAQSCLFVMVPPPPPLQRRSCRSSPPSLHRLLTFQPRLSYFWFVSPNRLTAASPEQKKLWSVMLVRRWWRRHVKTAAEGLMWDLLVPHHTSEVIYRFCFASRGFSHKRWLNKHHQHKWWTHWWRWTWTGFMSPWEQNIKLPQSLFRTKNKQVCPSVL